MQKKTTRAVSNALRVMLLLCAIVAACTSPGVSPAPASIDTYIELHRVTTRGMP